MIRGGAILPHCGHGAFKRGLEREYQRFLTEIGCPILLSVHGTGVAEPFATLIPLAENVWVAGRSNSLNQEGIDQIVPVLMRHGGREVHVMDMPTLLDTFDAGGEFHLDMVLAPVALRKLLVCPKFISWNTHEWLYRKGFELIEVPGDEQHLAPANLVLVEPGKVIMHAAAVKTIRAVERAGIDVIPFDCTALMTGGVNGPRCCTLYLYRDPGPELDEA